MREYSTLSRPPQTEPPPPPPNVDPVFYSLVGRQLLNDGLDDVSRLLASRSGIRPSKDTNILEIMGMALKMNERANAPVWNSMDTGPADVELSGSRLPLRGKEQWSALHKATSNSVCCNSDIFVGGGLDGVLRVMKQHQEEKHTRVTTKCYSDHVDGITAVALSPSKNFVFSGSSDATVRMYDYSNPNARTSIGTMTTVQPVKTLCMHPCGDHLLVGCHDPRIRLYDLSTLTPYSTTSPSENHRDAVHTIGTSPDGKYIVSGGMDGSIKCWDAESFSCVNTIQAAHGGRPVSSVKVAKSAKHYVLSTGEDGVCRLWDIRTGMEVTRFGGMDREYMHYMRCDACFLQDESYAAYFSFDSAGIRLYETVTGNRVCDVDVTSNTIAFAPLPSEMGLLLSGQDNRCRRLDLG